MKKKYQIIHSALEKNLQRTKNIMEYMYFAYIVMILLLSFFFDQDFLSMWFPMTLAHVFRQLSHFWHWLGLFAVLFFLSTIGILSYIIREPIARLKQKWFSKSTPKSDIIQLILKQWAFPCYVTCVILDLVAFVIVKLFHLPIEGLGPWPFTVIGDAFLLIYFRLVYLMNRQNT